MSWSANYVGTPEKIIEALTKDAARQSGKSKEEFDAALPHMVGLLKQNHNSNGVVIVKIDANGHGYSSEQGNTYGTCNVEIKQVGNNVLI